MAWDWLDEHLEELQHDFPAHDIWYVRTYAGGGTWCARPKGFPHATANAGTPEALREALLGELSAPASVTPIRRAR